MHTYLYMDITELCSEHKMPKISKGTTAYNKSHIWDCALIEQLMP